MTNPNLPDTSVTPSDFVLEKAAGRAVTPVWVNGVGGITWRLGADTDAQFLKVGPAHLEWDPPSEAERLTWAGRFVRVPEVADFGECADGLWLLTNDLGGHSAVSKLFGVGDEELVAGLGESLRAFHDTLPVAECPFTWTAESRLALATPKARERLGAPPPLDAIVAHGDACNPNFLFTGAGKFVGYVDLGRLGLADRCADLSAAVLSLSWNFPEISPAVLLDAYGCDVEVGDASDISSPLGWYTALWQAEDDPAAPSELLN